MHARADPFLPGKAVQVRLEGESAMLLLCAHCRLSCSDAKGSNHDPATVFPAATYFMPAHAHMDGCDHKVRSLSTEGTTSYSYKSRQLHKWLLGVQVKGMVPASTAAQDTS